MSKIIKLFHYEDNIDEISLVKTYIITINSYYIKYNLRIEYVSFNKHTLLVTEILDNNNIPDIIILDMYDASNKDVGSTVLEVLLNSNNFVPTIIYTTGSGAVAPEIDHPSLRKKYKFIFGNVILKSRGNEELKERIGNIINSKYVSSNDVYISDKDDYLLEAEIRAIGEKNIIEILSKIQNHYSIHNKFNIDRMSSGFSGAAVFKLSFDAKTFVLKVSNDKDVLREEHEKSKSLYMKFPSIFRNNIIAKEFETEKSYGILIENVHNAGTLFNWLQLSDQQEIEKFLKTLYSNLNGLTSHYKNNVDTGEHVKFPELFRKFQRNYAQVTIAIKELKTLLDLYYSDFDESDLKNLVLNGIYKKIDKSSLTDARYLKYNILCHGDFHANNIMVQGSSPIIIDTGGIRYDYWCIDICRLLVHLFVVGFDKNTFKFFDIAKIPKMVEISKKIIRLDTLELDGENDGYIQAINWLLNNVESIYDGYYCKWEFQLGLCKEFLQMSYRANSIPPNKRVVSLIAAYECILSANESLE